MAELVLNAYGGYDDIDYSITGGSSNHLYRGAAESVLRMTGPAGKDFKAVVAGYFDGLDSSGDEIYDEDRPSAPKDDSDDSGEDDSGDKKSSIFDFVESQKRGCTSCDSDDDIDDIRRRIGIDVAEDVKDVTDDVKDVADIATTGGDPKSSDIEVSKSAASILADKSIQSDMGQLDLHVAFANDKSPLAGNNSPPVGDSIMDLVVHEPQLVTITPPKVKPLSDEKREHIKESLRKVVPPGSKITDEGDFVAVNYERQTAKGKVSKAFKGEIGENSMSLSSILVVQGSGKKTKLKKGSLYSRVKKHHE